jgi:hypothetical protein
MFEKPEKAAMGELVLRSSARRSFFLLHDRDHDGFAARGFDLLERGLAEAVRVNGELLGKLAIAENFDPDALPLHETSLAERHFVHVRTSGELLQIANVDAHDRDREGDAKATLGQATLNRRLATLKVELPDVATLTRFLTLLTATAGLAQAGTDTATEALLQVSSSRGGREMRENADAHDFFS